MQNNNDEIVKSRIPPPLVGGEKGEGDNKLAEMTPVFTLTPALSSQGRESFLSFYESINNGKFKNCFHFGFRFGSLIFGLLPSAFSVVEHSFE
jgi:hypothetical protein